MIEAALAQLAEAADKKLLSAGAVKNIRAWLTEPRYHEYAPLVAQHLAAAKWKELDDVFWTIIPFGTGGRRGKMYPIGSNAINDRTIGESAQGLADYAKQVVTAGSPGGDLSCAIAYDTRHKSRHFAELCAEVMVAAGYKVYFLDGFRSTPELSFAVRYQHASCGIMVTASHNPPSDNAVKAYWSTGGQLLPPHDQGVIDRVMSCTTIQRTPFAEALASGKIVMCQKEVDAAYVDAVKLQSWPGPRDLRIIYSPLHGVGASAVLPVLAADGFANVELFGPHAQPDGDFPNVPGHVSNPENPRVFDIIIDRAKAAKADLVLATDPDCDRIGLAAPLTAAARKSLANDDRKPDWRDIGRVSARAPLRGKSPDAGALRGQNAGHHRFGAADCRIFWRAPVWRSAGRLQVHWRQNGRSRSGELRLRMRRVAWLSSRQLRPRQRRRGGRDAAGPTGRSGESGRPNSPRKAGRDFLAIRMPRRRAGFGDHARLGRE